MRVAVRSTVVVLLVAVTVLVGCSKAEEEPVLVPTIAPPLIAEAGVLRVGVDLDYPPFASVVESQQVGIEVDVAAALADRLGLKLELVDLDANGGAAALSAGRIDIAMGATSITEAVLVDVSSAGSYLIDGVGLFSRAETVSVVPTITAEQIGSYKVATQEGSPSFWELESEFDPGFTMGFPTLREAFQAVEAGEAEVVMCDAIVGGYIASDFPGILMISQYGPAVPLGITVAKDAPELEKAVRDALDALASEGVLSAIRQKWVGSLPRLTVGE
jgi:polar amino acid transport system substrate-binding protein